MDFNQALGYQQPQQGGPAGSMLYPGVVNPQPQGYNLPPMGFGGMPNPRAPMPPGAMDPSQFRGPLQMPQGAQQMPPGQMPRFQGAPVPPPSNTAPSYDQGMVGAVLQGNADASTQANINRARKLADAMRTDAGNQMQGRTLGYGRIYVAPNVGNLAASLIGNYAAGQASQQADIDQAKLGQRQQTAATDLWNLLRGNKGQGKNNAPGMTSEGGYGTDY